MPSIALLFAVVLPFSLAAAQNPVEWTAKAEAERVAPGGELLIRIAAKLQPGWHIYSLTTPTGGPTPTTIKPQTPAGVEQVSIYQPAWHLKFDKNFKINTETFEKEVDFLARVKLTSSAAAGPQDLPFLIRYQACTETECRPSKIKLPAGFFIAPGGSAASPSVPTGYREFTGVRSPAVVQTAPTSPAPADSGGLAAYLLVAFGFGLAAIFTPCVFPMIPITLSVFVNRPGASWSDGVKQALLFCGGIIVLFTGLGLAITAAMGPFGVVQLGSNPWVNGFIALVFLVFGLSLLGAFEITLPSSLLTRVDRASQNGGVAGTLLMGLTFSLTSFACVGPFVGTLLAGSVQLGGIQPILGMAAFASGLSTPFFLLAAFPAFLKQLPRSGGWLARVKVTLGFVVLAAMLKYLSSVDQVLQLNLLTRERFLAIWFVLFALAGLYLLGLIRMEGVRSDETLGAGRVLAGGAMMAFAFSLLPGMLGGRLGEIDALVPAASTDGGPLSGVTAGARAVWLKNDLESASAQAREEGKLLFVSFTGYACTNCKWMKTNMFTRADIARAMENFILVELYTDGTDAASEKNQALQESRFQTVSIPFYAIMEPDGRVISTSAFTRDAAAYEMFLSSGSRSSMASRQ